MRRMSRRTFLKWSSLMSAALAACQAQPTPEAPLLNLHNWAEYLNPGTVEGFQRESGVFIYETIFDSNEDLLTDLRDKAPGTYDLIVPTDYMVRQMFEASLLRPLDPSLLPNLKNIQAEFRTGRSHDPEGAYSVTKNWGTTGIIWRPDLVPEPITTWADLWRLAPKYAGRMVVVEARDEVIGAALKLLGYSYNETDPARLAEAEAKLMELRPHVGVNTDYFDAFQQGSVALAIGWNGDAFVIQTEYETAVQYILPTEGSLLWEDDWCLPASALHIRNAHAFINYLLRPEIAAQECAYTGYATVVTDALPLLDETLRNNPSLFPPTDVLERLERALPLTPELLQQREALWARFLAG